VVVDASVTFGELHVIVPEDVAVELDAKVTGGEIITEIGEGSDGMGLRVNADEPGDEGSGTIVLDLRMGFGELRVVRGV
jgi:predicted membrane protein